MYILVLNPCQIRIGVINIEQIFKIKQQVVFSKNGVCLEIEYFPEIPLIFFQNSIQKWVEIVFQIILAAKQ